AVARVDWEAEFADPAQVAHPAVDQCAGAAALLHADRDQLAEIADAFAIATPYADLAGRQALAGAHLVGVAAEFVRRHLAAYRVRPAGDAPGGLRIGQELRREPLFPIAERVQHVGHVRGIHAQVALAQVFPGFRIHLFFIV